MQKKGRAEKRELLFDGISIPGLSKCTALSTEEGELEVGELKRIYSIGTGQIKWLPLEVEYLDQANNGIFNFVKDWVLNKTQKDVTYIRLDGSGAEMFRMLLPDCECLSPKFGSDYDALSVQVAKIPFKLTYYEPIFLN